MYGNNVPNLVQEEMICTYCARNIDPKKRVVIVENTTAICHVCLTQISDISAEIAAVRLRIEAGCDALAPTERMPYVSLRDQVVGASTGNTSSNVRSYDRKIRFIVVAILSFSGLIGAIWGLWELRK